MADAPVTTALHHVTISRQCHRRTNMTLMLLMMMISTSRTFVTGGAGGSGLTHNILASMSINGAIK
jgi:hypothetical protein